MAKIAFRSNPDHYDIPVLDRNDLEELRCSRRDATLNEIWPESGRRPHVEVFYFEMQIGAQFEYRPSRIVFPATPRVMVVKKGEKAA